MFVDEVNGYSDMADSCCDGVGLYSIDARLTVNEDRMGSDKWRRKLDERTKLLDVESLLSGTEGSDDFAMCRV